MAGLYVFPHLRFILNEHVNQYIPHNIHGHTLLDFVEIGNNCLCGRPIIKDLIDIRNVDNHPNHRIGNSAKLFYCTNNISRHYFIKSQLYDINGRFVRCVYKYDNFFMVTNPDNNHTRTQHIPTLNTTHIVDNFYSNKSLKYFNKNTNNFDNLRRYIPSNTKLPLILRDYLKKLRTHIGRSESNKLYVVGIQYRTHPCDIQLGITETYKQGEINIHAKDRAKFEELQIFNKKAHKNIEIGRISNRTNWYIRYLDETNYEHANSSKNSKENNRANKIGLLIIGKEKDLKPLCENFVTNNINSRDDAIARPIIIKLNHILRPTHINKWFTNGVDEPIVRSNYNEGYVVPNINHPNNIINRMKLYNHMNNLNNNLIGRTGSKSNRSSSRSHTHTP